jgi:NADPH:quinone reductase-like Zn-dependent oxidoreductase
VRLRAIRDNRTVASPFLASLNAEDLRTLGGLIESGQVKPVVERTYPLASVPEALAYVGEGHARGKIVISIRESRAGAA